MRKVTLVKGTHTAYDVQVGDVVVVRVVKPQNGRGKVEEETVSARITAIRDLWVDAVIDEAVSANIRDEQLAPRRP